MGRRVQLPPDENERLRSVVRDLSRRIGSDYRVAHLLDVSSGALSQFLKGKTGASVALAGRINDLNADAQFERIHAMNAARTLSTDDLRAILAERMTEGG